MQAKATAKMIRVAPRKVRLLLDELRGKSVEDGLTLLRYSGRPSAEATSTAAYDQTNMPNAPNPPNPTRSPIRTRSGSSTKHT